MAIKLTNKRDKLIDIFFTSIDKGRKRIIDMKKEDLIYFLESTDNFILCNNMNLKSKCNIQLMIVSHNGIMNSSLFKEGKENAILSLKWNVVFISIHYHKIEKIISYHVSKLDTTRFRLYRSDYLKSLSNLDIQLLKLINNNFEEHDILKDLLEKIGKL